MPADVPRGLTAVGPFIVELWLSLWTLLTLSRQKAADSSSREMLSDVAGGPEELFSAAFSRVPWKRAWGSTSSTNVEEDDSDVDGATSNREWTQTRILTKIAGAVSVCTEGSREVTGETLAKAAIKLFSLCTRNIS